MPTPTLARNGRRYNLNEIGSAYPGNWAPAVAHSQLATAWSSRVVTNGGAAPSDSTLSAIDTFSGSLVTAGISTKMLHVNIFAPDNLNAALTPLIVGGASSSWYNVNFVGADLSSNGLKGNASNKYVRTGFLPSTHFGSDSAAGITLYYYDITGYTSTQVDFAANYPATSMQCLLVIGDSVVNAQYGKAGQGFVQDTTPEYGYYSVNRTTSTDNKLYYAKSSTSHAQIASSTTNSQPGTNNVEAYMFTGNEGGPQPYYSGKTISFMALHQPLTSTESSNFYNAIQALRTSLGGGYR